MTRLAELLQAHFAIHRTNARHVAARLDLGYASLLSWSGKGGIPRKFEHREALRRELALPNEEFVRVLAASGRADVTAANDGPDDLARLVVKHLHARGLNERTFADLSGMSYATVIGITKRGAVPRAGALEILAEKTGVPIADVRAAAQRSRVLSPASVSVPDTGPHMQSLARLAAERIAASGQSAAAFAHTNGIPYLALSSLLSTGNPPERAEVLEPLRKALGLDATGFAASLERTLAAPEPSQPSDILPAVNPFHSALLELARKNNWNQSAFAKAADMTALTASKLLRRGELPGRQETHRKLRQLLGLDEAGYSDLLTRSSPQTVTTESSLIDGPALLLERKAKHPLQAALLALIRERIMTQNAFAQAADLSVLTASRLLKGDLPGREKTNTKLRQMLGLSAEAYAELLAQSQPDEHASPVDHFTHADQTALIPRVKTATTPRDADAQRLFEAIKALGDEHREVVWNLVRELQKTE